MVVQIDRKVTAMMRPTGNDCLAKQAAAAVMAGLLFCATISAEQANQTEKQGVLQRVGRMEHPELQEVSGIVRDRTRDDAWWVINDSGCPAKLYRIGHDGEILKDDVNRFDLSVGFWIDDAVNVDWEDIAVRDDAVIAVDMGNNANKRRNLGLYIAKLPTAAANGRLELIEHLQVRYPDQKQFPAATFEFDCESAFFIDGVLHFLTKHRVGQTWQYKPGTKLYRLGERGENGVHELVLIDRHDKIGPWVTGADVSPNGQRLAVITQHEVWIFDRPAHGNKWLSTGDAWRVKLNPALAKQAEAICWDNMQTLRIANEQRDVFVLDVAALERVDTGIAPAIRDQPDKEKSSADKG